MIAEERYNRIIDFLGERKTATVQDLMDLLGASESTVRRDLDKLDRARRLRKVRGGAATADISYSTHEMAMSEKYGIAIEEKASVAEYAAHLICDGDFVYIDAGTTTEKLVDLIGKVDAVFATNSVAHARKLAAQGLETIVIGGTFKAITEAIVGPDALETLARYHFTKGFWGTNGVTAEQGFTTPDAAEAQIKRFSMEHCGERYVICDAGKFGRVAPVTFAEFSSATVVTSALADESYREYANVVEVVQ